MDDDYDDDGDFELDFDQLTATVNQIENKELRDALLVVLKYTDREGSEDHNSTEFTVDGASVEGEDIAVCLTLARW